MESKSPKPGQPPIPLSTSKAFIVKALQTRRQEKWFRTVAEKSGLDHLSRIRADVSAAPAFFVGTRLQQTLLARLRFGICKLNYSTSRFDPCVNEECKCGALETVNHFLLHCPLYEQPRSQMIDEIRSIWRGVINEDILLGGGGVRLPPQHWTIVIAAVAKFVISTKRRI